MKNPKKEKIKKIIDKYKNERDEYLDGWKRAKADHLNYKKDEQKRFTSLANAKRRELLLKVIGILDDFQRAEKEAQKREERDDLIEGFLKIKEQLEGLLFREGVQEIKTTGEEFDPHYHEAIENIENQDIESGFIAQEVQKGYLMDGEVIRPAKVKVAK